MISKDELSSILMYYGLKNHVRLDIKKILDNAIAWWKEINDKAVYIHIVLKDGLYIILQPEGLGIIIRHLSSMSKGVTAMGDE